MTGEVLLDTNIVIAFFGNDPDVIREMIRQVRFLIPSIAVQHGLRLISRDAHFRGVDGL